MRVTIKDIAREMKVNVATVSRALNEKPGVSPDLRRQIQKKAAELHYFPHGHARGLVTQRMETVGLLFDAETSHFLANPFYGEVLAGVEEELRQHNYAMMFASTSSVEPEEASRIPKFVMERRVDGIVVVGSVDREVLRNLDRMGVPFVLVDYHLPDMELDVVIMDNRKGGRRVTEYLIELGHRRIAFVGGCPLDEGNYAERLGGYCDALRAAGMAVDEGLIQEGTVVGGYDSLLKVLDRCSDVTAVVACNDANAFGAMRAAQARGLQVPEQLSIAGFDNLQSAAESYPPLTTVQVDKRTMGRTAVQRLVQKMQDKVSPAFETVFPPELVVRESTAARRT